MICLRCGNSGFVTIASVKHGPYNEYCRCKTGREMQAKETVERMMKEERQKEADAKGITLEEIEPPFEIGDWVEVRDIPNELWWGVTGIVVSIDRMTEKAGIKAYHVPNGKEAFKEWVKEGISHVEWEYLKLSKVEGFDPFLIDLALQTNDKDWFMQLVKGLKV